MKKKSLLVTILLLLITVFAFSLTACNNGSTTLETLKNEYGIVVDGGSFEEGSTLVSNEIVATTEEAAEVLEAIADQNYNKDGSVYIFDIYVTKDGKEVQPDGKVKVSIPVPNVEVDNYLVFHVKSDNSVESLVPTVADGKISFETSSFSYFVIAEAVIQDAPPIHVHNFEWVEGKESTCKEEGIAPHYHCDGCGKNFNENYAEIDSVITEKGSHDVGLNYSPRVEPTFFMEGTVAYYICNDCLQFISEDGQIIPSTDISIPTLPLDISVCVNGAPTELALQGDFNSVTAEWKAEGLSVKIGDVITVCLTDDTSYKLTFTCDGIVDENGVVTAACEVATVDFYADHSSLHLVMLDPTVCEHNYVWVEGKEPTCEEEGVVGHFNCEACGKNFDPNYGEMESISIPKAEHEYGSLYWGKSANFFEDGNIEYYQCSECEKYFDNEYNEVETPVIPKYSTNISICVNGVPTALAIAEQFEGHIIWTLDKLTVKEGDVITVCCTDNPDITHNFWGNGIIDQNGKITMTAVAQVVVEATNNGVMLSINYIYEETYEHYLHHIGVKMYDMTLDESNPNVVFIKGVTLSAGDKIAPAGKLLVTNQNLSYYFTLAEIDESIAVKNDLGYVDIVSGGTFDFYFDLEEKILTIVEGNDYEYNLNHVGVKSYDMIPYEYNPNVVFIGNLTFDAGTRIGIQAKKLSTNQNISYYPSLFDTDQSIAWERDGYIEILSDGTYDFYFDFVKNELTIVQKDKGIVIEINGVQYPMNYVTYSDEQTTGYIYGLVNFAEDDKFVVVDKVNNIIYDYDDLCATYNWNTWDFHRGDNGEFVIDNAGRYGIEFDGDVSKEIYIDKHFVPLDGGYYEVVIEGEEQGEPMQGVEAPKGSYIYNEIIWYYNQESVMNAEDIIAYIEEKGLYIYTLKMTLAEGTKINIKMGVDTIITADHLTNVNAQEVCVTKEGDYVKILSDGVYTITYLPAYNAFAIHKTEEELPDAYIYCDIGFVALTKDANNVVTYEGLVAEANDYVTFFDGTKTKYLSITLDSNTDSTVAHVITSEGLDMLFFDKAGTYNLAYNVDTGVLSITSVGGDDEQGGNESEETVLPKDIYISTMETYAFIENPDNSDELCYLGLALESYDDFRIRDTDNNYISDITLASGTTGAYTSGSSVMVEADGTYNIYINKTTHEVRIVAVS